MVPPISEPNTWRRCAGSVIEVQAAHAEPNFRYPYQMAVPEFSHSTAFAVPGRLLLTNAHCVAWASHVQVKRRDQDTRFGAEVLCLGFECDLALLAVDDEAFWDGLAALEFSEVLPALGDGVTVLGFGMGGDNLCNSQGVVSRVDVQSYPPLKRGGMNLIQLPVIQIDAAINPGNSGGPALSGDSVIGVAFMGLDQAQSVGYIIPAKVALHFIEDYKRHGQFTQFAYPPFRWQTLDSADSRAYYDVIGRGGVRITKVDPNVDSGLRVDDVLLDIFGKPVGHDGKVAVELSQGSVERVSLWFLFCDKFTGTNASCTVRRAGQDVTVEFELAPCRTLVDIDPDVINEYLIVAGVVLQPLTVAYISDAEAWGHFELQKAVRNMWDAKVEDRQLVVASDVLSHSVNAGLILQQDLLDKVNGTAVRNLAHAAELVDSCTDKWLSLEFSSGSRLVLQTCAERTATTELVERHGLLADRHLRPPPSKL